jgi:hypothetical protein
MGGRGIYELQYNFPEFLAPQVRYTPNLSFTAIYKSQDAIFFRGRERELLHPMSLRVRRTLNHVVRRSLNRVLTKSQVQRNSKLT